MTLAFTGERQVAPRIDRIRHDHVARYDWASQRIGTDSVVDVACGVGYGAWLMASQGATVLAIDKAPEAIDYAKAHYSHPRVTYRVADAALLGPLPISRYATCFETLEHLADPLPLLRTLAGVAEVLFVSVPNEDVFPWHAGIAFHHRHYTRAQFEALLAAGGWRPMEWWGQEGPESDVTEGAAGRTLVAVCERAPQSKPFQPDRSGYEAMTEAFPVPDHVAILGLGPSLAEYVDLVKRFGGKHAYCDEVWGINAVGGVLLCDRIFHMDDVRIQEVRAAAAPTSNIARMLEWLRVHPGPIITSRAHPDYPGLVEFPLQDVLNSCGHAYFNSTAAYAVAYAIHIGVKRMSVFGCDYTYPNAHDAEKGRACMEFWLGQAAARGIRLHVPKTSSLLDALHTQEERLYGYDTLAITIGPQADGMAVVRFEERSALPSAAEIEARYDHSAHPSALVANGKSGEAQQC